MKSHMRRIAAWTWLCSGVALNAAPILFLDYTQASMDFGQTRAAALALPNEAASDVTAAQLSGKSVVIMPGAELSDRLLTIKPILTSFVQSGGYLWINLAGSACASDATPGGSGFSSWSCGSASHNSATIAPPDHPYFTGAFAPTAAHALTAADFLNWEFTDGGHISNLPDNATTLLTNSNGPSLTEFAFGNGWVVVSSLTYGWGQNGARTAAMDNMLLYAAGQVRGSGDEGPVSGIPEPATAALFATGAAFLAFFKRRRHS